jgi:lysophospholipase L1-like esterase
MKQILVYADSLSWGIIPNSRERLSFEQRWPIVMENELIRSGLVVRVIEDCLNGRRTVWEDPYKPGRNGLIGLEQRIEINSPLALVILLLGTNDFQSMHQNNVQHSALGIATLVRAIRNAPIEPGMPIPKILIAAPPPMREPGEQMAVKFAGAPGKSKGLAEAFAKIAAELNCHFFDAGSITPASKVDGIHLDADQHELLGRKMAEVVATILQQ